MNLQDFANIAEVVGAIAVVISLIYLAIQVKSTTEQNRATMEQAIADSLSDIMMVASSSDVGAVIERGLSDMGSLNDVEKRQFAFYLSGWFRVFEQAHRQFLRGFLDAEVWSGHQAYLGALMQSDSVQRYWDARQKVYNPKFRALIRQLVENPTDIAPVDVVREISAGPG